MIPECLLMALAWIGEVSLNEEIDVARIATAIEELCGKPIRSIPRVISVGDLEFAKRWDRLAGTKSRELTAESHRASMFYDHEHNEIVRRQSYMAGERSALRGDEIEQLTHLLVFHEVIHAWQREHCPRQVLRLEQLNPAVFMAIMEGHAEWLVLRYAEREGIARAYRRIIEQRQITEDALLKNTEDDTSFYYLDGYRFWNAAAIANSQADVWRDLADRPPSERDIVLAAEYLGGRSVRETELEWAVSQWLPRPNVESFRFTEFRNFLRSVGHSRSLRDKML